MMFLGKEFSSTYDNASVIILPIPFDGTSTWQKGADKGPEMLIEASNQVEVFDIETNNEPWKQGIYTDDPVVASDVDALVRAVAERVSMHRQQGKFVLSIGGEHSVSIGAIQATKPDCVLQLDAHADLRESYEGSKNNHACVMARAKEICPVVQVGIRSVAPEEKGELNTVFYAHDLQENTDWISDIVHQLKGSVYITIDLDVFDSNIMPSTGTPEPGGLTWYPVLQLLKEVFAQRTVIGADIVELCPSDNKAPDFLAAKLVYKLIAYRGSSHV